MSSPQSICLKVKWYRCNTSGKVRYFVAERCHGVHPQQLLYIASSVGKLSELKLIAASRDASQSINLHQDKGASGSLAVVVLARSAPLTPLAWAGRGGRQGASRTSSPGEPTGVLRSLLFRLLTHSSSTPSHNFLRNSSEQQPLVLVAIATISTKSKTN